MFEEDESVFAAMRAGARGYLLKGYGRDEVLRAVPTVAAGEAIFGPAIAERFTSYFAAAADGAPRPFPELTVREHEVLELMARGAANGEIVAVLDTARRGPGLVAGDEGRVGALVAATLSVAMCQARSPIGSLIPARRPLRGR